MRTRSQPSLYFRDTAKFHLGGDWDGPTIKAQQFGDGGNDGIPLVGNWDGESVIDKPILYFRDTAKFHLGDWDGSTKRAHQFGDEGNDGIPFVGIFGV